MTPEAIARILDALIEAHTQDVWNRVEPESPDPAPWTTADHLVHAGLSVARQACVGAIHFRDDLPVKNIRTFLPSLINRWKAAGLSFPTK